MAPQSPSALPEHCNGCGCPLVGNEIFCSSCGLRLVAGRLRAVRVLATLGIVAALILAGMCLGRGRLPKPPPVSPRALEVPSTNP